MQNKDYPNLFFVGDCNTGLNLNKQAIFAKEQGNYAAETILKLINKMEIKEYISTKAIEDVKKNGDARIFMPLTKQGGFG